MSDADIPIVQIADVELIPRPAEYAPESGPAADFFACSRAALGERLGAKQIGCNITAVPPGKAAYPFHSHLANEELFLVLQGEGELRYGERRLPLRAGDLFACPAGGPGHQIRNSGQTELRYLALSTKHPLEICQYPDSGKFGAYDDRAEAAGGSGFYHFGKPEQCLDYWEGEGPR